MARLSNTFKKEAQDFIRDINAKEVLNALKQLDTCETIPQNVQKLLDNHAIPRVNSVTFTSYEYITKLENVTYYGDVNENSCFACTLQREKVIFPALYIYEPEKWSRKAMKKLQVSMVRAKLRKAFELELPDEVASIIRNELPDSMPEIINFEGCKVRFDKLTAWESNQVYGGLVVTHTMRSKNQDSTEQPVRVPTWTIYIEGIDYIERFAQRVANTLNIPLDLARRISSAWEHDIHVSIYPEVSKDARQYAALMASRGEFNEEDTVNDLLQGTLPIITDSKDKLYLDIDDELPSAVIIKGKLSVYLPPNYIG